MSEEEHETTSPEVESPAIESDANPVTPEIKEFSTILSEMSTIKPPGVSGSRIKKLKALFLKNVDQENALVDALVSGCKSTPASNKLGPLYVVDAVIRGLLEELGDNATKESATPAPEGTAAAAVAGIRSHATELVEDATKDASDSVKDKVFKLVEIWQNCHTFDVETLQKMKSNFHTTTPPGSPPRKRVRFAEKENEEEEKPTKSTDKTTDKPAAKDPASVLQALASLAKKAPSPASSAAALNSAAGNSADSGKPANAQASKPAESSTGASAGSGPANSDPNAIFKMLQSMNQMGHAPPPPPGNSFSAAYSDPRRGGYRDRGGYGAAGGETDRYAMRRRERSPRRGGNGGADMRGGPDMRDPRGEQNVPSNPHYRKQEPTTDGNLPPGTIGVYSRTIFIGGVPHSMTEAELARILRPYAEVQSVILNSERKHAFVKVYSRPEAEQVIQAFSVSHPSGLRARWGVGYGPRDCCNYQDGVSTIPLSRLTDADKRWAVSAQWGGTGGAPLVPGMFIEEPDIEVGHGISSKSISRKMPTNSSSNGPKSDGMPVARGRREYGNNGGNAGYRDGGRGYGRDNYGRGNGGYGGNGGSGNGGYGGNNGGYGGNNGGYGGNNGGYGGNSGGYGGNNGGYGGNNGGYGGNNGGYGGNNGGYNSPPVANAPPVGNAPPAQGGNPNQLMSSMMAAMQQMQNGQGQGNPADMAQMFQNMAQMMKNQHQ